jgi:hypothetical protein
VYSENHMQYNGADNRVCSLISESGKPNVVSGSFFQTRKVIKSHGKEKKTQEKG